MAPSFTSVPSPGLSSRRRRPAAPPPGRPTGPAIQAGRGGAHPPLVLLLQSGNLGPLTGDQLAIWERSWACRLRLLPPRSGGLSGSRRAASSRMDPAIPPPALAGFRPGLPGDYASLGCPQRLVCFCVLSKHAAVSPVHYGLNSLSRTRPEVTCSRTCHHLHPELRRVCRPLSKHPPGTDSARPCLSGLGRARDQSRRERLLLQSSRWKSSTGIPTLIQETL